jgi:hypothetical protein
MTAQGHDKEEGNPMNRFFAQSAGLLPTVILMASNSAAQTSAAQTKTFKGEITDDKLNCIQTPLKAPADIKDKYICVPYWAKKKTQKEKAKRMRDSSAY